MRLLDGIGASTLSQHPAILVWQELMGKQYMPTNIETIKDEADGRAVYRLTNQKATSCAIIAKRCLLETGQIERIIYEQILPKLPLTAPHYYGFVQENQQFCWLFLEDVGSMHFSAQVTDQRRLATQWLAQMHAGAAHIAAAQQLPDRGSAHYLEHLRMARHVILSNFDNAFLQDSDKKVLEAILGQCRQVETNWEQLENCSAQIPSTLVHGDFRPKNVLIRTQPTGESALFPLDWETAGWGPPAADLAPSRRQYGSSQVDLPLYCTIMRQSWPHLNLDILQQVTHVGFIFRRLAAIYWASLDLEYEWVSKPISTLAIYQAELAQGLQAGFKG